MNSKGEPKICVYAICKNEEKFIPRWIESLKEADCIVVLDTGSTDNSVAILEGYSPFVLVKQVVFEDFRFDVARNESMKLIPDDTDICVVSDCDQIFRSGWANILREAYKRGVDEVYGPIIDYDDQNNEIKRFLSQNVHPNKPGWYWDRPIHEGIYYHPETHGQREIVSEIIENFVIEHHPDRSKSRDYYLDLLEKEYIENSSDPMCMIYYGCELSFHNRNDEALDVFLRGMEECDFTNHRECGYQTCLNISLSYAEKGDYIPALKWAIAAFDYGIKTRRLIMNLANVLRSIGELQYAQLLMKLAIKEVPIQDESWIESSEYFKGLVYENLSDLYKNIDIRWSIIWKSFAIEEKTKSSESYAYCANEISYDISVMEELTKLFCEKIYVEVGENKNGK